MTLRHTFNRGMISFKHNYPTIAFGVGIGGMLAGTVLACRATLKLEKTLDDTLVQLDNIESRKNGTTNGHLAYGKREAGRDALFVYGKAAWKLVKLYGPAVLVGGASIGLLTNSHTTLLRRNRDLALAYAALDRAYQAYRDKFKGELDAETKKAFDEAETNLLDAIEELGQDPRRPNGDYSPFARIFDEFSPFWERNALQNLTFVEMTQTWANHTLKKDGVLYLNDIYKHLGFETQPGGQIVGWVWDDLHHVEVDFDLNNPNNERFRHGWEQSAVLDFNVQGLVLELIRETNTARYG